MATQQMAQATPQISDTVIEQAFDQTTRWTRDYVFDILKDLGIHYIFGVPGTNEIPIIDGTSYPENEVRYIECLHENIAIGAAMGSARMTGKPGVMVVHVTPGIAHSIGNLFNAYRSQVPLVVLCCQQQNELVTQEPLLASNLVDLAKQYTKWAHEVRTPQEIPMVLQRAFKEAMAPPNGPVFVSIPWDFTMVAIEDEAKVKGVTRISPHFTGDDATIKQAADILSAAKNPVIVAGDAVGYADAWKELQELAELLGAPVVLQTFSSLANFPNNDYHWQGELPGSQAGVQGVFKNHDVAFLVGFGAQAQLAVYKYSDGPLFPPELKQVYLTNNTWDIAKNYYGESAIFGDIKATLPILNEYIKPNPPAGAAERNERMRLLSEKRTADWDAYLEEAMEQEDIWAVVIAKALKEEIETRELVDNFVYVHEAVSDAAPFQYYLPFTNNGAKPVSYYCVAGGSLGWSMPASLGIKLENTSSQGTGTKLVVNAVGDGSSLFYPQTYWTAAHEQLPILYIITNNQEYHTLQLGLQQVVGAYGNAPGYGWKPKTMDPPYLRLERPKLDFVSLAKAFGGEHGEVVQTPAAVKDAIRRGIDHVLTNTTSYILDMRIAGNTPTAPSTADSITAHYSRQPVLDYFHKETVKAELLSASAAYLPSNIPSFF
ncbi:thiamine pyrophosphate-binding protein [Chitinophaga sancti]|uniref:Benzoylformate decarboxylase n=1 Tax=Chitinophaga sancti TaxID=1004 RepID=A0A1K1RUN5_9BACT|nr:thiamine pyrophosphate-binding protein [Chitinophaga sancti]WQD62353.1 thiamine pyrophosphate-binding protein [Chitinophaga sancti]WQG92078.1 thiamine pyrophosphate-binding protein [Chitinophaga sancti]SFW75761.1 benzoylformate decarboxylase [Chitinophaga sancti]